MKYIPYNIVYLIYTALLFFFGYKWYSCKNRLRYFSEEIANLLHDVKNHGMVIEASGKLLKMAMTKSKGITNNDVDKHTNFVEKNCSEMNYIIQSFIEESILGQRCIETKMTKDDIVKTVKFVIDTTSSYADKKNIYIQINSQWPEKNLFFDKGKTKRILLNLLMNAVKYSNENDIIKVYIKDNNKFIEISIKDNGEGIANEEIPYIFNKYYRSKNKILKTDNGFGIGLYASKRFARMQGGDLLVNSIKGEGSTFSLLLPLYPNTNWNLLYNSFYANSKSMKKI